MHCLVHSFYFVNVKKLKKLLQITNDIYIAAKKSYKRVLLEQLGTVYCLPPIIAILFSSNKIIGQFYTVHRSTNKGQEKHLTSKSLCLHFFNYWILQKNLSHCLPLGIIGCEILLLALGI